MVLTGTDLYRDLPGELEAARILDRRRVASSCCRTTRCASLQPRVARQGAGDLPVRAARSRRRQAARRLDCVAVGHLRDEKDPRTLFAAVRAAPARSSRSRVRHIGAPLDAALGARGARARRATSRATATRRAAPRASRARRSQRAHVLVHPSVMEGGANVIVEAVTARHAGAREPHLGQRRHARARTIRAISSAGDASGLAARLVQALEDPRYRARLAGAVRARARRSSRPRAERAAVRDLVAAAAVRAAVEFRLIHSKEQTDGHAG